MANVEKKVVTIKRGKRNTMPQVGELAEPRFTTDTRELWINDGDGRNILVGSPNNIKFKNNYENNITYDMFDLVNYNGTLYLSLKNENINNEPLRMGTDQWMLFIDLDTSTTEKLKGLVDESLDNYSIEISEEFLKYIPGFTIGESEPGDTKLIHFWFDTNPNEGSVYVNEDLGGEEYDDSPPENEDAGGSVYSG